MKASCNDTTFKLVNQPMVKTKKARLIACWKSNAEIVVIHGSYPRSEKYQHKSENIISKNSLLFPEEIDPENS